MLDLSLQQILTRLVAYVVVAWIYGLIAVRATAAFGDKTPTHDGRGTLAAIRELDAAGLVASVVFGAGWARPLDVERGNGWTVVARTAGWLTVSLVGVLAFAILVTYGRSWVYDVVPADARQGVAVFSRALRDTSLAFVALNILPIPPLAAGHLLEASLPLSPVQLRRIRAIGRVGLFAALLLGLDAMLVDPVAAGFASLIEGTAP